MNLDQLKTQVDRLTDQVTKLASSHTDVTTTLVYYINNPNFLANAVTATLGPIAPGNVGSANVSYPSSIAGSNTPHVLATIMDGTSAALTVHALNRTNIGCTVHVANHSTKKVTSVTVLVVPFPA